MVSPAEHSKTYENDDRVDESPPEAVASQPDSDTELAKLEDRWRRAVADLDNLRKRYARELDRERTTERSRVAGAWLPVVDNLERAIAHTGDQSDAVVEGVRSILDQALQVLEQLGYPRDAESGVPFAPQRHEVVGVVEHGDSAPGTVVEVLRPGYGQGSSQLRPAAVVVRRREEWYRVARDYYEVLGVSRDATADQIQQAFRTLARKYHPDVNRDPAAEDRFKEVNEAYHVLSDPDTRKRYDRFGEDFRKVPEDWEERAGAGAGGFGGFGGAGPSGVRVRYGQGFGGAGGGINIEDLFGDMFGGGGGFGPIPGADQEAVLELTVEEAYRGGRRQITLDGRNYGVNIPARVTDGQRIRLAGEGGRGSGEGPAGDLYLRVRIKPHPRFRLDGRDVTVDLPVSPWEAVLGTTVAIRTPGGEAQVKVR